MTMPPRLIILKWMSAGGGSATANVGPTAAIATLSGVVKGSKVDIQRTAAEP